MTKRIPAILVLALLLVSDAAPAWCADGPFDGKHFMGRIAYSADGNHNDPDDWIASPMALAIFAEAGLKERLVHFDYNCILPLTNAEWERTHAESVLGAAERYGFDRSAFFDCRQNFDAAVASIAQAVNDSSADNPLYFIIAGPMEAPHRGIQQSDPAKRQFVYCISHSRWNDGFSPQYEFAFTKRSVIEQDVRWLQIADQNRLLSFGRYGKPSPPEEFAPYFWMRDSSDPKLRFLWERMVVSTRPDPSDAGMAYFLATGDEQCDPGKLKELLADHRFAPPASPRKRVRLEAENFRHLEGFALDDRNDPNASHRLGVKSAGTPAGRIRTRFDEPFTSEAGRYDVAVRYFDEPGARFASFVNGAAQGEAWDSSAEGKGWTTHTVRGVAIRRGDEIAVETQGTPARLDYVQLDRLAEIAGEPTGVARARLRVAVVQMFVRGELAENRDRIVAGIEQAAERGARVAVFPEGALSGRGEERQELADQALDAIRRAARERNIYVVLGVHSWLPSVKKTANWMLVIAPDGRDAFRYEKLYDNHRAAMPGVFAVDGAPCSTMICADRWLRGVVEIPIQQGSQINFELSNNFASEWVAPYEWYWSVPLARRNTVWCVLANSSNQAPGAASSPAELKHGHSAIIAPDGHLVSASRSDCEDLLVADLDLAQATRAEALARAAHPALRLFWEAGVKLQRGETIEAVSFKPRESSETDVTLAAASVAGDLDRIEALVREAHARGADLVAFPAQAAAEDALERLKEAARQSQITVVFGATRREADGLRNSAFVIGPDGAVLTRYDQLSAAEPFQPGADAAAMWFRVKGAWAFVTLGRDALWTELSELAAVAGARIHIHLDHETDRDPAARQQRLATWANAASFHTFTVTANVDDVMLWDDLRGREEIRAAVKGGPQPDSGAVEVYSPFSANLIARASPGGLAVATRRVTPVNGYHPSSTSAFNPQMKAWYELGAKSIGPRNAALPEKGSGACDDDPSAKSPAGLVLDDPPAEAESPVETSAPAKMRFRVHEIGRPGGGNFGQTSAVDVDQDGDLDFISGRQFGDVFWFENRGADGWTQHVIGEKARTDVGGVAFDVDGDGWVDQVSGGTWYRNPGDPRAAARWERFENGATPTHDNLAADIDGDGKLDLVSILDKAGVFWYRIPPDPTARWIEHKLLGVTKPQCHGGIAVGDIDGDGDNDVARVDRWLENADGQGETWVEHRGVDFGKEGPWGLQTRAKLIDLDRDGDLDLVQAEGDVLDGRVAWFENQRGDGKDWKRHLIKSPGHNQDFHSICVADFDNDGDVDVFSGGGPLTKGEHQWFLWENADGKGGDWKEHLIQRGLRTHESVCGDVDGDGDIDILTKPWSGDLHLFVENLLKTR